MRDARFSFTAITERARQTAYLVPGLAIHVRDERPRRSPGSAGAAARADWPNVPWTERIQRHRRRAREAEFRFDGGISEFCEHLASGEPVTDVLRLVGLGNFTETVPVLDDRGPHDADGGRA